MAQDRSNLYAYVDYIIDTCKELEIDSEPFLKVMDINFLIKQANILKQKQEVYTAQQEGRNNGIRSTSI